MTIFFSGGCKNGKSTLAENCTVALAKGGPLYYVATMIAHDAEDEVRIQRHIASRSGKGFSTLEQGLRLNECLERADACGAFLLDSVTALLSNEMFGGGDADLKAPERVAKELVSFAGRVGSAVFVSDFLYSDAAFYDAYTEAYRRGLALCDRALAQVCDVVAEVSVGCVTLYKGALPL